MGIYNPSNNNSTNNFPQPPNNGVTTLLQADTTTKTIAANPQRLGIILWNNSDTDIYFRFHSSNTIQKTTDGVVPANWSFILKPGGYFECYENCYIGAIQYLANNGNNKEILMTQLTLVT